MASAVRAALLLQAPRRPRLIRAGYGAIGAVLVVASLAGFGCSGGDSSAPATATVITVETPAPTSILVQGDPNDTVENAVGACAEKNGDLLRSLVAGNVSDADLDELFSRGSGVRLLTQDLDPEIEDGLVTIEVTLDVDGEEPLERSWDLEESAGGGWLFSALPDCY